MALRNAFALVSTEAKQDSILTSLAALLTELQQKLEPGGEVALNAATLAALESITVAVSGAVALDAPTLAALETINAVVSGTVALDAGTLAALETITAVVSGTVAVSNHPSEFPLPGSQILTLTPQTNALTDAELRASAPPVRDDYSSGEILADQTGAGAVLTFTFSSPVHLAIVESAGADLVCRADPFGGVPAAALGIPCHDEAPSYMPVMTAAVKVYAPVGTTVSVWGFRRS